MKHVRVLAVPPKGFFSYLYIIRKDGKILGKKKKIFFIDITEILLEVTLQRKLHTVFQGFF